MRSVNIRSVHARQILDCKGRPAVEVDVVSEGGAMGRGAAPTGTSVGMYEAHVLRDGDPKHYFGMSVMKAVDIVNNVIAPALVGMDVMDQRAIDQKMLEMDGTELKQKLGGNSIYSVSLACVECAARILNMPLYQYLAPEGIKTIPYPTYNMINGGHYPHLSLAFQETTIIPYKVPTIAEAVEIGVHVFAKLGEVIQKYQGGKPAGMGNYWAWAPPSDDPLVVMELLATAAEECGVADLCGYALDCASSEMYDEKTKTYQMKGKQVDADEVIGVVKELSEKYDLLYVEDILDENDWDGYTRAVREISRTVIIGDDLTVTSMAKLKKAAELKACEGFIFKPNQIGSVTECLEAKQFADDHGWITVPSIRAGGIVNDAVMDMAVGLGTPAVKHGPPRTGERVHAINFLSRAEEENPGAKPYDFSPHAKFK